MGPRRSTTSVGYVSAGSLSRRRPGSQSNRRRGAAVASEVEGPPLHLVTGWSKAKGKPPHNPDRALFGGWRLSDWEKRKKAGK